MTKLNARRPFHEIGICCQTFRREDFSREFCVPAQDFPIFFLFVRHKTKMARNWQFENQYELTEETKLNHEIKLCASNLDARESVLFNLQLIFLMDISGSMQTDDVDPEGKGKDGLLGRGKWTRYDNMVKILKAMISDLFKYDKDQKIPCYFFNHNVERIEITDPNILIAQARRHPPSGSTALHLAFQTSLQDLNDVDNFLYIVFTDGAPDNPTAVEQFIKNEIYGRDPGGDRINILFLRHGDDRGAMQFLENMDDHPVFGGNVDTKSDNAAFALGPKFLVLNAIFEEIEKDPYWANELKKYP